MSRFDDELQELDRVIKEKRQAVADAQLAIKDAEHNVTNLQKERVGQANVVAALEKGNPWIESEKECVPLLRLAKVYRLTLTRKALWQTKHHIRFQQT